jgi:hypothetical protein
VGSGYGESRIVSLEIRSVAVRNISYMSSEQSRRIAQMHMIIVCTRPGNRRWTHLLRSGIFYGTRAELSLRSILEASQRRLSANKDGFA